MIPALPDAQPGIRNADEPHPQGPINMTRETRETVNVPQIEYEVWQAGEWVASSNDRSDAEHYMTVYGQDGPVEAKTSFTYRYAGFMAAPPAPMGEGDAKALAEWTLANGYDRFVWRMTLDDDGQPLRMVVEVKPEAAPTPPSADSGVREKDLILQTAMQNGALSFSATMLADALRPLVLACETADMMEELPDEIDGSLLDAANRALDAYDAQALAQPAQDGGAS